MPAEQFVLTAKSLLSDCLQKPGIVVYSHPDTLHSNNDVAFLGYNPGCDPTKPHPIQWKIEKSLDNFGAGYFKLRDEDPDAMAIRYDLINEQVWPRPRFRGDYPKGQAPYQQRVRFLLKEIDHSDAVVANLFFRQSINALTLRGMPNHQKHAESCWSVHKFIFEITHPRVIITFKSPVEEMFRRQFGLRDPQSICPAGQGTRTCKHWRGSWQGRPIDVIAFDHFWIYDVTHPRCEGAVEWAKEIVRHATN